MEESDFITTQKYLNKEKCIHKYNVTLYQSKYIRRGNVSAMSASGVKDQKINISKKKWILNEGCPTYLKFNTHVMLRSIIAQNIKQEFFKTLNTNRTK